MPKEQKTESTDEELTVMDMPGVGPATADKLAAAGYEDLMSIAVATPGHTADHISVLVQADDTTLFLAGDTSYNETLMLDGRVDGVSPDERTSRSTLKAIGDFAQAHPTVYLPTHDPQSGTRLANRRLVATPERTSLQAVDLGSDERSYAASKSTASQRDFQLNVHD